MQNTVHTKRYLANSSEKVKELWNTYRKITCKKIINNIIVIEIIEAQFKHLFILSIKFLKTVHLLIKRLVSKGYLFIYPLLTNSYFKDLL